MAENDLTTKVAPDGLQHLAQSADEVPEGRPEHMGELEHHSDATPENATPTGVDNPSQSIDEDAQGHPEHFTSLSSFVLHSSIHTRYVLSGQSRDRRQAVYKRLLRERGKRRRCYEEVEHFLRHLLVCFLI